MDIKDTGLVMIFISAAIWLWSFTHVLLSSNIFGAGGIFKSALCGSNVIAFICSLLVFALGMLLIKFESWPWCRG